MITVIHRLFECTTARSAILYLVGNIAAVAALSLVAFSASNIIIYSMLVVAALMWWPFFRDLAPVVWSVAIQGRWPLKSK